MHLAKVDLNLFVVFDTIYAEGGITRASRRLNLSQPAISHALARIGWSSWRDGAIRTCGLDLETFWRRSTSPGHRGLRPEDFELGRHNLRRRIRLRCQNYFAACRVVSETDLVVTMPTR